MYISLFGGVAPVSELFWTCTTDFARLVAVSVEFLRDNGAIEKLSEGIGKGTEHGFRKFIFHSLFLL